MAAVPAAPVPAAAPAVTAAAPVPAAAPAAPVAATPRTETITTAHAAVAGSSAAASAARTAVDAAASTPPEPAELYPPAPNDTPHRVAAAPNPPQMEEAPPGRPLLAIPKGDPKGTHPLYECALTKEYFDGWGKEWFGHSAQHNHAAKFFSLGRKTA